MSTINTTISNIRNHINRLGSEIYITTTAMMESGKSEKYVTLAHDLAQDTVARANELIKVLELQNFNTDAIDDDIAFLNRMIKFYYEQNQRVC